ncbi:MAG: WD40/YVTN/BNR-like repeat-containing protein [Actinomycetota bacterium]
MEILIDPSDPKTAYANLSRWGLYRSRDGGESWSPLPLASTTGFAEAHSEPTTLYATTLQGEKSGTLFRVWKSEDAGDTWHEVTPSGDHPFTNVTIDPSDPSVVYASGLDAGLWTTRDGGATWAQVSDEVEGTGPGSVLVDPTDPGILYVSMGKRSLSPAEGVFVSNDGGATWTQLGDGFEGSSGPLSLSSSGGTLHAGSQCGGEYHLTLP